MLENEFKYRRRWGPTPKYDRVEAYKPDPKFYIIAGPCSVESEEQINEIADIVASVGATHLRGGVFRAGTYPGDNFGWIPLKLRMAYHEAAKRNNLQNIVEILDYDNSDGWLEEILLYADCVQVGCRQMQNYTLLTKVAQTKKTVFLKRNPGATIDEWLGAAEYILKHGGRPVLIERGSSGHATHVRWDLSISMIAAIHAINPHLPVIVDASHGTGRRDLVKPMTWAGVAAGADGCLVEVHTNPSKSLSDADQAVSPLDYEDIMEGVYKMRQFVIGGKA